jgi:hypothetical protein
MARKLRKGRERCGAACRDGHPCQAPAVPELLRCRRHGAGTAAALLVSRRLQLQLRLYIAVRDYEDAKDTPRRFDMLCRAGRASDRLDEFEEHVARLALIDDLAARLAEQQ